MKSGDFKLSIAMLVYRRATLWQFWLLFNLQLLAKSLNKSASRSLAGSPPMPPNLAEISRPKTPEVSGPMSETIKNPHQSLKFMGVPKFYPCFAMFYPYIYISHIYPYILIDIYHIYPIAIESLSRCAIFAEHLRLKSHPSRRVLDSCFFEPGIMKYPLVI